MASTVSALKSRKRVRHSFGSINEVVPMPNLIEVQRNSYDLFLQRDVAPHERGDLRATGSVQIGLPDARFRRQGRA